MPPSRRGQHLRSSSTAQALDLGESRRPGRTSSSSSSALGVTVQVSATAVPASIAVGGQNLQPTERGLIYNKRRTGMQGTVRFTNQWTSDPILLEYRFCNAYRVLDRTSHSLDPTELLFRILLFNCFNRIDTWKLLEEAFHGPAHLRRCRCRAWDQVLSAANYAADGYERLVAYQGMGASHTAYQLMLSLSYSSLLHFSGNDFVVPGPGACSGLAKMFGRANLRRVKAAVPDIESNILRWLMETQRAAFRSPWASEEIDLGLADIEHAVCEVDKYARMIHPKATGIGNRTKLRARFQPSPDGLPAVPVLPKAWADSARQVAKVRPGSIVVQPRYCISKILGERSVDDE
ncbi:hypothetical protein B0H14DRAFT_2701213, partial [Mycena olivaceomarginata]